MLIRRLADEGAIDDEHATLALLAVDLGRRANGGTLLNSVSGEHEHPAVYVSRPVDVR
jgi:hypothetical protein